MIHRKELLANKVGSQWRIFKSEVTKRIGHRIHEPPREMATLNRGDPQRAEIVREIRRLRDNTFHYGGECGPILTQHKISFRQKILCKAAVKRPRRRTAPT
jgi:hypothetical protein